MTELARQTRQKGETSAAHQAYLDYRDMGISRSLRKLHERYTAPASPPDCPTNRLNTLENWSSKYAWQKRIEEWEERQQTEKEKADAAARLAERTKRADLLEKMRNVVEDGLTTLEHAETFDEKKFNAVMRAMKAYMELSMRQYNDLPTEKQDVTQRAMIVNFNTEPIPEDVVNERLKQLGLAHYVQDQTE